jgi:hypothetical protein
MDGAMWNSTGTKVLAALAFVLPLTACSSAEQPVGAPEQADTERAADLGIARPNTLQDPAFLGQSLNAATYFETDVLGQGNSQLEQEPDKVFLRSSVAFGDRLWERITPDRFELAGSNGTIAFEVRPDFSEARFLYGHGRSTPFKFAGTLAQRRLKAGFVGVAGMSGRAPAPAFAASVQPIPGFFPLILILLESQIGFDDPCPNLEYQCHQEAIAWCHPAPAIMGQNECVSNLHTGEATHSCQYSCGVIGGSGGGSGVGSVTVGESIGESFGSADGTGGGGSGGIGGSGGGDATGGGGSGGCVGAEELQGYQLGSLSSPGGILDYAAADETSSGGDGDDGGGSTGC